MNPVYVHQDSAPNIAFDEQGILLDTFFSQKKGAPRANPNTVYPIYQVAKSPTGSMFVDKDSIYQNVSNFKMPPIE